MKTYRIIGLAIVAISLCLSACGGGGDEPITPTPTPEVIKSEITIDSSIITNGLSFTSEKGKQSISFSTNESWTLSVANTTSGTTWCTASATSGSKGNSTVKFNVTENTDYDNRSVSVTIKSGTATKTFTITQKCADALLVTTDKYEIGQEGGAIDIEVKANINYKMEISDEAKEWITESSDRGLTAYKHSLNIDMNEENEKREGEVYFKSGDKVETVKIYQAGGAILLLSENEYQVSDKGDTISVDIKSNIDFGVQMPDVNWIVDEASSRGLSSHTLKYIVTANEEYDSRSASIVFYDKNSDLKDTLKVVQAQKDAISLAKNEYTIESVGGDLEFEVNTNVDFEVSTSVDWIKQNTESRGLEAKSLSFIVDENISDEAREGLIIISSGDLKQEIKVIQKAKLVFSLSETEFNITSEGGEFDVKVSTNGEYSIIMPEVDWLTENKSRATSTYIHTFMVSANETYDTRETEIVFTHKETNEAIKVKVMQVQKDAILISQKTFDIKAKGETIEVKISSNVDFDVTIPNVDWINQTDSRTLEKNSIFFKIEENTSDIGRSAEIMFTAENSHIIESITINQAGMVKAGYADGIVTISTAGTMKKLLGDGYLDIKSLKVIGPINGDDVYSLREMLGAREFNNANRKNLTTLDLSEASIVKGGEWYYKGCYTVNNVIGENMFSNCTKLRTLILPNNITTIDEYAFCGSEALTSIKIPDTVKKIGMGAFYACSVLTSIKIPDNVTSISYSLFWGCNALKSVTIGKGVTSISSDAFKFCKSLKSINIPDSVVTIGMNAFDGCCALTSATIGKSVTSIGYNAFSGCYSLTNIYCYAINPPKLGSDAFSLNANMKLYVPTGRSTKYKSSDWSNYFRNIIEIE